MIHNTGKGKAMGQSTERVAELQKALTDTLDEMQDGLDRIEIKVDGINTTPNEYQAKSIINLREKAESIRDAILLERYGPETKAWLDSLANGQGIPQQSAAVKAMQGGLIVPGMQSTTVGTSFVGSPEFKQYRLAGGRGEMDLPHTINVE
ncbi:MAG: hypothetical protein H0U53_00200, partial [Actinobacteria bacterium]|nr:hypothetical protein [Actinomycetota bacterium]